jgi:hypothetical protein
MTDVVTLCSRGQQHVMAGLVDCLAGGADALKRGWQIVEWRHRIPRGVLDRQARNTRCNAASCGGAFCGHPEITRRSTVSRICIGKSASVERSSGREFACHHAQPITELFQRDDSGRLVKE